jgi:sodium-coupled neutral amino acid transporter 11
MVSYNVIVGDTVTKVVVRLLVTDPDSTSLFASREFISLITALIVTLPISLYRSVATPKSYKWITINH